VFLTFILGKMPFYVVRQGRIPGIYNTWFENKWLSVYFIQFENFYSKGWM